MHKIVLIWLTVCIHGFLLAQDQIRINGCIIDGSSSQPLESATIRALANSSNSTFSDAYGHFTLLIRSSVKEILVSFIGYKSITYTIGKTREGLTISIERDIVSLKDLVIFSNSLSSRFATLGKIDLDLKPVSNTQELLCAVPGLFIAQHAGGGKAEQIFLRGFDGDHGTDIQVSVDGLPVNMVSHAHGQGYADAHFIIPETINNLDYGTGPYYTQHGNLNTAGYINFTTLNKIDKSRIQLEAGRFGSFRSLAMIDLLKKNKDKESAYLAADYYYTNGPTDNKQKFNRVNVFGKYNLSLDPKTQFSASLSFFTSNWNASGQIPTRAVESGLIDRFGSIDPSEGGNTQRENLIMRLSHRFSNESLWENQAFYSHYIFNLYSNFSFYLQDSVHGDEINQAESRNLLGYLSRYYMTNHIGDWKLEMTLGAGFRYDATDSSKLAHVVQRQFLNYEKMGKIREANAFAFAEEQFSGGNWMIDVGLRYDYLHFNYDDLLASQMPSQSKAIFCPKLNIQYTVNPHLQVYMKSGKGFHSNDTRLVVTNQGNETLPAAYGADLGFVIKPNSNFYLNVALWYLYLQQEFVYAGDDGQIQPNGQTVRKGIDIIARYQFTEHLFANMNLNFAHGKSLDQPKGQNAIPLAPGATSTGGLFYRTKTGWNGGISYRYMMERPANEDNSLIAKGYFLTDASIKYSKPTFEIGLAFENLFNAVWNEAQFATESRLKGEQAPVTDLNFTPGTPFFVKLKMALFF